MAVCALDGRTVISAAGGQVEFTIGWDATLIDDDDVLLWFEDVSAGTVGAEVTQGAGAGKFVVDRAAGTCTLGTAAEVGDIITIERHQSSPTRLTIFTQPGDFIPSVVNNEFDHYLQLLEDLGRDRCRSVRMDRGVSLTGLDLELPAPEVGRAIGWVDANTLGNIGIAFAGGSGTSDTIPLWTPDGLTLGDSIMTQSSTLITIAGTLTVNTDTNGTTVLGRAKIGNDTGASMENDTAYFGHFDHFTETGYALRQVNTSRTTLNSADAIAFAIANVSHMVLSLNEFSLSGSTALIVNGGDVTLIGGNLLLVGGDATLDQGDLFVDGGTMGIGVAPDVLTELAISDGAGAAGDPLISFNGSLGQVFFNGSGDSMMTMRGGEGKGAALHVNGGLVGLDIDSSGNVNVNTGTITAGSGSTVLTTTAGLLRHQAIDPDIAGAGITYTNGELSVTSGLSGSGTENTIPLWGAGGSVLGDSRITQFSTTIAIAGVLIVNGAFLTVSLSSPAGEVTLGVTNAADADTGSDALLVASVAGAGSGDPFVEWTVTGEQSYTLGIDNSDSDKFVGSVGSVLGTSNWLEVTTVRGITLDAASGQTVSLAVDSVEELQVSGTAVIIPTNNLIVDGGNIGITAQTNLIAMASNRLTVNGDLSINSSGGTTDITMEGVEVIRAASGSIIIGSVGTAATAVTIRASGGNAIVIDVDKNVEISNDLTLPTGDVEITGGMLGIGNPPTLPLDVNAKAGITSIGGIAIKLTNKSGGTIPQGKLVITSTGTENAFQLADASDDRVIGIVLEGGVTDGSEAWIVVAGFAMVLMDAGGAALGDRIITSTTAGVGLVSNSPAPATHFQEIGHAQGATGAGGLVKCAIHLN